MEEGEEYIYEPEVVGALPYDVVVFVSFCCFFISKLDAPFIKPKEDGLSD